MKKLILITVILLSSLTINAKNKIEKVFLRGDYIECDNSYININDNKIELNTKIFNDTLNIDQKYKTGDIYTITGNFDDDKNFIMRIFNKNNTTIIILDNNINVIYISLKSNKIIKELF